MDVETRARDEWIALRCVSGAPGAFEDLVALMERPLLYYATKLTRNDQDALDILQEVWIVALRGIRKLSDPGSLRPWLYKIVYGIAVDRLRRQSSRQKVEEAAMEEMSETVQPSFANEDIDAIHRAIDKLSDKEREILTLCFLEEFSTAEVAAILRCPEGTVKSRVWHAKQALKQKLKRGDYGN